MAQVSTLLLFKLLSLEFPNLLKFLHISLVRLIVSVAEAPFYQQYSIDLWVISLPHSEFNHKLATLERIFHFGTLLNDHC